MTDASKRTAVKDPAIKETNLVEKQTLMTPQRSRTKELMRNTVTHLATIAILSFGY
jgi:hypothetical protein